jgi:hypothetical protein
MLKNKHLLFFSLFLMITLISCSHYMGGVAISKPDEYSHVYEAKEKIALRAIASVFREKDIGTDIKIDEKNHRVDSDYREAGDWRTKAQARVKQINWKECEVKLAVTSEKKTEKGWEMRRLLEKEQYDVFFRVIDLRIYEEMSKIE